MRPPFIYFGGKQTVASRIVSLFPRHFHYIEPFAGSLAVLLSKPPSQMETINDLDHNVVNFWRVLRDQPEELERACLLTPHSRQEYKDSALECASDLEKARRFWVALTQGRSGRLRDSGWRHYKNAARCQGMGSYFSLPRVLGSYCHRFAPVAMRLKHVTLECRNAFEIIEEYGRHEGNLLYLDPPYVLTARTDSRPAYQHELSDQDHRDLAKILMTCRAKIILSGYESELYSELFGSWEKTQFSSYSGNANEPRTETIWANFKLPIQQNLFDDEELNQCF